MRLQTGDTRSRAMRSLKRHLARVVYTRLNVNSLLQPRARLPWWRGDSLAG
ncbi:MAG TPA: hypothetical protein VIQ49_23475 [Williamsia sp.]